MAGLDRKSVAPIGLRFALLATCLACASPAFAHPPYEHPERTIKDQEGRPLYLVRSYGDGIFFTDPVKLVVRDGDDRTILETPTS